MRVLVVGATGYIGQAAARELVRRGHEVVCGTRRAFALDGAQIRVGDLTDRASVAKDIVRGEAFDAVVSCLASRNGAPDDARLVDRDANLAVLEACKGVGHFVLLSAICLQKPLLAFQHAKLEFEAALRESGVPYSIVRPTAFFKSLSGQVAAVKRGKPYLLIADGTLTACKPISERDLATYLADCLGDPSRRGKILPIGGPGPAITPKEQGEMLFEMTGQKPRFRHVPVRFFDVIIGAASAIGVVSKRVRDKAELARIGRYYATESMLVWNGERYDADATPEFGTDTLRAHYERVLRDGMAGQELGDHALFS